MADLDLTGYHLTFDDEFDSFNWNSQPSSSVATQAANGTWSTQYWWGSGDRWLSGNGELEYYSDASTGVNPFSIEDGTLVITAAPSTDTSKTAGQPYTSGMITTEGTFSQEYGYFEMRAQLPAGQGLWPAFWLLPQDHSWPPELDILEAVGKSPEIAHTTVISGETGSAVGNGTGTTVSGMYTGFHTYGAMWTPDTITFYIDGQQVFQEATPSDFHKPMYLLANLAVGGSWPGSPDSTTPWPAQMKIDYIRVYSNDASAPLYQPPQDTTTDSTEPQAISVGSGPDSIVLKVAQDYYQGSAHYTVSVDGVPIGGVLSAGALNGNGATDTVTVHGDWAAGAHTVTVNFVNDLHGGDWTLDRNLYVKDILFNGTDVLDTPADLYGPGPVDFSVTKPGAAVAPPASFGGQDAKVAVGPATIGGETYTTYDATVAWSTGPAATLKPAAWQADYATKLAFDNFVQTNINLSAAGSRDLDVMLLDAKRGAVTLGDGNDSLTWVAHSNNTQIGNTMVIKTGAGDDTVKVTTAALSSLDDHNNSGNGGRFNPDYDGRYSTADVTFGSGHDSVTVEGKVALLLHCGSGAATAVGGAGNDTVYAGAGTGDFTGGDGKDTYVLAPGNGAVTVDDFVSGQDVLHFTGGLTASDISTEAATQDGIDGLMLHYGTGGEVFLAGLGSMATADMLFG